MVANGRVDKREIKHVLSVNMPDVEQGDVWHRVSRRWRLQRRKKCDSRRWGKRTRVHLKEGEQA
jgi:hypothetical protein